ncbi:MAG TPA: SRPBCC domain-containing protein [Candidatus Eisenbacteria bacterium]|nr:SRPBCC domain-containing protein [Candidatus Eisenbacteria bacterium]
MDSVFRALADATRRSLLDELFRKDGQTLTALEARFSMTRFGVMKHLRLLEKAGLVVTKRRGREKLHFLNPVPIRLVHDRWVSKYAEPWAAALSGLKDTLEERRMEKVFEIYIKTTPERLWQAITDPEMRSKYQFGSRFSADFTPGSRYEMSQPNNGGLLAEGENLEIDPPRRLVQTMQALWGEDVKREGTSRITWEIEPVGDSCRLTVTHDQLREGAHDQLYGGWPMILSGLKTLLETGELLTTPGSLMYGFPTPASAKRGR